MLHSARNLWRPSELLGFPGGSAVKNPPANAGDAGDTSSSLGLEDPLEEETAAHSSMLAWRIPWAEDTGGLQSTGLRRVRHDWARTWSACWVPRRKAGVAFVAFALPGWSSSLSLVSWPHYGDNKRNKLARPWALQGCWADNADSESFSLRISPYLLLWMECQGWPVEESGVEGNKRRKGSLLPSQTQVVA